MSVKASIGRYFKKHPFIILLCLVCIGLFTLFSLAPPQILKYFVDEGILKKDKDIILITTVLYFSSFVIMNVFNFGRTFLTVVISQGISKNIRLTMLNKVNKLNYVSFTKFDSGTLEAYFSNDVDSIDALITSGVVSFVIVSFYVICIFF